MSVTFSKSPLCNIFCMTRSWLRQRIWMAELRVCIWWSILQVKGRYVAGVSSLPFTSVLHWSEAHRQYFLSIIASSVAQRALQILLLTVRDSSYWQQEFSVTLKKRLAWTKTLDSSPQKLWGGWNQNMDLTSIYFNQILFFKGDISTKLFFTSFCCSSLSMSKRFCACDSSSVSTKTIYDIALGEEL